MSVRQLKIKKYFTFSHDNNKKHKSKSTKETASEEKEEQSLGLSQWEIRSKSYQKPEEWCEEDCVQEINSWSDQIWSIFAVSLQSFMIRFILTKNSSCWMLRGVCGGFRWTYTQMFPVKLMWGQRWGLHITATTAIWTEEWKIRQSENTAISDLCEVTFGLLLWKPERFELCLDRDFTDIWAKPEPPGECDCWN